jgi:cephalosporin hydroxylase
MKLSSNATGVSDDTEFKRQREVHRSAMGEDLSLRNQSLELLRSALAYKYPYQFEWCGVPVIRHPEDLVLLQEIFWIVKPAAVVETGIARAGGLLFSASLMRMMGVTPKVLGLDVLIMNHARDAVRSSSFADGIEMWQGDSASSEARTTVQKFISLNSANQPIIMILDSDHSHAHVLAELKALAPLVPLGSVIVVADTLIEDMPPGHYPEREWGPGNSPLSAIKDFLKQDSRFATATQWSRRGLLSEIRDGVLERVN